MALAARLPASTGICIFIKRAHLRAPMVLCDLECGTDFEKAGAMIAMYWATGWSSEAEQPSFGPLREPVKRVVLHTFIRTANIDLRRALSRWMNLSEPETTQDLRELQGEALSIAERLDDDYLCHIVDQASLKTTLLKALPHRRRPDAD